MSTLVDTSSPGGPAATPAGEGAGAANGVGAATSGDVVIELRGITKRFPGVIANEDINLKINRGEIHAICGENGAGKSTLMKIIYGMQPPDEGSILINGSEANFHSPRDAIDSGIGMVHQHFMLAGHLSVLENIVLGAEKDYYSGLFGRGGLFRSGKSDSQRQIEELCELYSLDVNPNANLSTLEVGQRQKVEIIKALYRGARILILDEPTAVLVPQEVEELFETMREMASQGETILFIDHKLDEVLAIADRITVIRAGRSVATVDKNDVTASQLAELMIGSELPTPEIFEEVESDEVLFDVRSLNLLADTQDEATYASSKMLLRDINFSIRRGEILGIAGVEGNGQAELVEALLGVRAADSGSVIMCGEDITHWSTRERREGQLGYIPEDRHEMGLLLPSPLWENAMLGHQGNEPYATAGFWLHPSMAKSRCAEMVAEYDVRTPNVTVPADALSGGNQQKLIIGREMVMDPKVLIAAHPTRGIDVGAQDAVWEKLRAARHDGLAVLLVSADLDELIGLSDRLLVILRGELVAELDPGKVTPKELGSYMTGAQMESEEPAAAPAGAAHV